MFDQVEATGFTEQPAARLARGLALLSEAAHLLASVPMGDVADTTLGETLEAWDGVANRLDAAHTARVDAWEAKATWSIDGAHSGATWLASHTHQPRGTAAAVIRLGRALRSMPLVAAAFADGQISATKARMLADAAKVAPEHFARDEEMLLGHARNLRVDHLRRSLAFWRAQTVPDDEAARTAKQHDDRHVSLSRTFQGTWRLDGTLTAEDGEILHDALTRMARARYKAEQAAAKAAGQTVRSTAGQRRADAIVELARMCLANENGTSLNVPSVTAVIDVTRLMNAATGPADLVGHTGAGSPLTAEAARRLTCDAHISRIITGPASAPIDLGTTARLPSPAQRRALAVRDGGCAFPGCDRPPGWCHAHHIDHWSRGGTTDVDNMVLLCSHHHHRVHEGGFGVRRRDGGTLEFTRPDGSSIVVPYDTGPSPLFRTA